MLPRSILFRLPPSVLLTIWTFATSSSAGLVGRNVPNNSTAATGSVGAPSNGPPSAATGSSISIPHVASTGSGPEFATACVSAISAWSEASSSWSSAHESVVYQTQVYGGTSLTVATYYSGASTLCDGHARVTASPAIPLSLGTITLINPSVSTRVDQYTIYSNWNEPFPSCSISPTDCDPLWDAYDTSATTAAGPQVTAPPLQTPPCLNQSAYSAYQDASKSVYGCGECTIYGEGVQLVYFPEPTTVSRDMCASTPSASLTHYNPGAVITAYAGNAYTGNDTDSIAGQATAVVSGHTFTSGTAYISIASVYAVDRCSNTKGSPVQNAILAMPSQSVLSLRYSQDHFQRFMATNVQTGYPVSYADFTTPIPWSAWNGQNACQGPFGGWPCSIIYENQYRPQLAIPPEIRGLSPEWAGCQNWYNGLWDPPIALTRGETLDMPTLPGGHTPTTAAAPSSAVAAPTIPPTAVADQTGRPNDSGWPTELTVPPARPTSGSNSPNGDWTRPFTANGHTFTAHGSNGDVQIGDITLRPDQPSQSIDDGVWASCGDDGKLYYGASTAVGLIPSPTASPDAGVATSESATTVILTTISRTYTIVQASHGASVVIAASGVEPETATLGGPAVTEADGLVFSAMDTGLAVGWSETMAGGNAGSVDAPLFGQGQAPASTATVGISSTLTLNGNVETILQSSAEGPIVIGGTTLTPGGSAVTFSDGEVASAVSTGIVLERPGTISGTKTGNAVSTQMSSAAESAVVQATTTQSRGTAASNAAQSSTPTSGSGASIQRIPAPGMAFAALVAAVAWIGG